MAGIAGVLAFDPAWNVARFNYYSLLALQHRGQEEACMFVSDGTKIEWICGKGFVDEVLPRATELPGWASIGGVWSEVPGYYGFAEGDVEVAVVVDGRIFNGTPKDVATEISMARSEGVSGVELAEKVLRKFKGTFSLLALTSEGEIIAYRSPPGLRPLQLGGFGFDMAVFATESVAFDVIGADLKKDFDAAEAIYVNQLVMERRKLYNVQKKLCVFEYIYNARPDSVIDGIEVYKVRERLGRELAKLYPRDVDAVVGVPETALPFAIGYSKESGKPYDMGFVATGRKARTAIRVNLMERVIGVQLKLNPIRSVFRRKRVLIIDDSVVRGLTLKTVIQTLRNRVGAVSVDVLIGSPKIISECRYGVEVPPADQLIASQMSDEEIARYIGARSINWLPPEKLPEIIGVDESQLCMGCFTGKYPVETEEGK
ncbi:amidophosphoribosyltransferase [Ignicoccus islandicus DSM 13165]|uniref:Amidophosphoribosyltransferase n=1 Tax=Ignicoccus islandicus DSM 13165 TaxID=940295 RepID=A0A0U3E0F4_9CREN|nr:amidophosphoribosyltransferase [Ignicoccus islandicus]ALU11387.1 amidophosphoribosyltransferase [Ignicoccus islandicus DSM 13165]